MNELRATGAIQLDKVNQNQAESLLARGLLTLRPSLVGDILCLAFAGYDYFDQRHARIISTDVAANIVYFQAALSLAADRGYSVNTIHSIGQSSMYKDGNGKHILMAKIVDGGYSQKSIQMRLKCPGVLLYKATTIVVVPENSRYDRFLRSQSNLVIWRLNTSDLSTRE